ncbi:nuclease [Nitrospirales bacterium NOB]|nr:nuclease [Nitrospirales bacterium NOB]
MRPILLLAYSFFLAGQPVGAEVSTVFRGQVVGIADGDTITILDSAKRQHKIRLSGIDAPESHQPFGQRSKANLSALVFNREVVAECGKTDKYNRQICKVLVGDADANLEQVKAGMAWWYRHYSNEQSPRDREAYEAEEFNAKIRRLGLWVDKAPVPPWEWRHRGR